MRAVPPFEGWNALHSLPMRTAMILRHRLSSYVCAVLGVLVLVAVVTAAHGPS